MGSSMERSEFGRGVVICLAKFSAHLENDQTSRVNAWIRHTNGTPISELPSDYRRYFKILGDSYPTKQHGLKSLIEIWANAASDHFYDLDETLAPPALKQLASLTLEMGHGFTDRLWTEADWVHMHDLWERACMELDKQLGVPSPDWGQW